MSKSENGTISSSYWEPMTNTMLSTSGLNSPEILRKVKRIYLKDRIIFILSIQSMGSLEKMNQIRPDDRTLEELFQKTIVNDIFYFFFHLTYIYL